MICRRYRTFEEVDLHVRTEFTTSLHKKLNYVSAGTRYKLPLAQLGYYTEILKREVEDKYGSYYK